jgi:hypothetical protein
MPPRQGGSIFNKITRRPQDSALVLIACGLIILTENVKLVAFEPLNQPLRNLLC